MAQLKHHTVWSPRILLTSVETQVCIVMKSDNFPLCCVKENTHHAHTRAHTVQFPSTATRGDPLLCVHECVYCVHNWGIAGTSVVAWVVCMFFCCKSKFIHSVLSSLHHLSHVISEPLFQHFQNHWKSGATFVAALWFYFVSGDPLPQLVHLSFSVIFTFLLIPSCSNVVLLRHVGGALITLWTHIFYICFGMYLSVSLSDAQNKQIIHLKSGVPHSQTVMLSPSSLSL